MADMQDAQSSAQDVAQEPQGTAQPQEPQGSATDWKAEARKWEERAKQNKARLTEFEDKAKRYDELEEAQKSDIERITDQATKAQAEADEWKGKFEAMQAEREHEQAVRAAAATYGVDVDVLMRMGGDVDENAKFLQGKEAARPKFGDMHDGGEQKAVTETLDEALAKAKNTSERIRIRAEFNARNRK